MAVAQDRRDVRREPKGMDAATRFCWIRTRDFVRAFIALSQTVHNTGAGVAETVLDYMPRGLDVLEE